MVKGLLTMLEAEIQEKEEEIQTEFQFMLKLYGQQNQEKDLRKFMELFKDEIFEMVLDLNIKRQLVNTIRSGQTADPLLTSIKGGTEAYNLPHRSKSGTIQ